MHVVTVVAAAVERIGLDVAELVNGSVTERFLGFGPTSRSCDKCDPACGARAGCWTEAEKSFGDASVNELGYIKADALYGSSHHGHNVHYLSTSYAFDGQYEKAFQYAQSLLEFQGKSAGAIADRWIL